MTRDELLEHINKDINEGGFVSAIGEWFPARSLLALRAVVELHKPMEDSPYCEACCLSGFAYPCPTIQAIEKELG